jgi:hypothetical protein
VADERKLCAQCIGDGPLKQWLEANATAGECDFDQSHIAVQCTTVDDFAEFADEWFRENYQPGADTTIIDSDPESDRVYHGTEGEPYEDIFSDELSADDDVLQAVIAALPDASHWEKSTVTRRFTRMHTTLNRSRKRVAAKKPIRTITGSPTDIPWSGRISVRKSSFHPGSSVSKKGSMAFLASRTNMAKAL